MVLLQEGKRKWKEKSISTCHVPLAWTLCMLPGGLKLKEDHAGINCPAPLCPSALRLWWEVAQWRTSSSTSSYDASLWRLPEPSHACVWIQGVWRGMPRVLRQFCWSTRDSSGWDQWHLRQQNTIWEALEMGVQGSIRWRSMSSLCSPRSPAVTALWALRGCSGRTWGSSSACHSPVIATDVVGVSILTVFLFFFFLVPRTFPKFASFPCSPHLISFDIPHPLTSA